MLKRLQRFAASWARILGGESAGNDSDYAEELVQNALADTIEGVLRWDPDKHDLEPYLVDVVRLRARRDRKRAARHEHMSIDTMTPDDPRLATEQIEMHAALNAAPEFTDGIERTTAVMARRMARLRELSTGDPLAQRFLDAVDEKASTREEVIRISGLTSAQYHNTRRRLVWLVNQLEPDRARRQRKPDHETE